VALREGAPVHAYVESQRPVPITSAVTAAAVGSPFREPNRPVAITSTVTGADALSSPGFYDEPGRPVPITATVSAAAVGPASMPRSQRPLRWPRRPI
jgi:hypothetical protein